MFNGREKALNGL